MLEEMLEPEKARSSLSAMKMTDAVTDARGTGQVSVSAHVTLNFSSERVVNTIYTIL